MIENIKQKSAHVIARKSQNTRCPVVSEVHKHVIIGAAAKTKRAKLEKEKSCEPDFVLY